MFKCDDCGRFVSYADLGSGKARRKLIYPDSEYTRETWETVCAGCAEKCAHTPTPSIGLKLFSVLRYCRHRARVFCLLQVEF